MSLELIRWERFIENSLQDPCLIVDLRNQVCYQKEHVKGAVSLPYTEWEGHWPHFPKGVPIYLYCDRGNAALLVGRELDRKGYQAIAVMGGYPKPCDFE